MKVILFGTGRYYQRWKHSFDFNEVVVLLDNDPEKQGQLLDGYRIDHPNHIRRYEYDSVFILVKNPEMIRDQLKQMNIPEQKIYDVKNPGLFQLIPTVISFMTNTEKRGIRVLLLTHTMDLTGAPLVLFDVARILSDNGLQIHVISLADGPLREYYLRAGISVTIAESMLLGSTQINFFYQWAQLIFVNTLVFYPILNVIRNDGKRVVWWLHEEENFYREYEIDVDAQESFDDMQIYGVGNRVMRSFHRFFPKASICELLYGIEERPTLDKEHVSVVFAFIGTCDHRKGEDVFRAATRELNKQIGMRVEYWIIGEIDNEKEEEYRAIDGVRLLGAMAHKGNEEIRRNRCRCLPVA